MRTLTVTEPAYLRITGIYLPELNVPGVTEADWATLRPWTDATTPRTDRPVRFYPGPVFLGFKRAFSRSYVTAR